MHDEFIQLVSKHFSKPLESAVEEVTVAELGCYCEVFLTYEQSQ